MGLILVSLFSLTRHYNLYYGARSLQHAVDSYIINRIASAHEKGFVQEGSQVSEILHLRRVSICVQGSSGVPRLQKQLFGIILYNILTGLMSAESILDTRLSG